MSKLKKLTIITAVLLLSLLGIVFLVPSADLKENSPPAVAVGKRVLETATLEIEGKKYEGRVVEESSVYDFMSRLRSEGAIDFKEKKYSGMGKFIEEINGLKGGSGGYWIYYVNGKEAKVGVSSYQISPGDVVTWKYEKSY